MIKFDGKNSIPGEFCHNDQNDSDAFFLSQPNVKYEMYGKSNSYMIFS